MTTYFYLLANDNHDEARMSNLAFVVDVIASGAAPRSSAESMLHAPLAPMCSTPAYFIANGEYKPD
jgi:hypothetical protein